MTTESDWGKVAPTTLLKSLFVMGNFLNIFQEFSTNIFQYKKQLSVQKNTAKEFISQDYESGKYVFGEGVISSSLQV